MSTNTQYQYDTSNLSQAAYSTASTTNPQGKSQRYTELAESNNDDGTFVHRQYEETGKPTIQSSNQIPPFEHEDPRVDQRMMRKIGQVADMDPTRPVFGQVGRLEEANDLVQEHPERHHDALETVDQKRAAGRHEEGNILPQHSTRHHRDVDDLEQHRSAGHHGTVGGFQQPPPRHAGEVDDFNRNHPLRHQEGVQDLEQQFLTKHNSNTNDPEWPLKTASTRQHEVTRPVEQPHQPVRHHETIDKPAYQHRSGVIHDNTAPDDQPHPARPLNNAFATTDLAAPTSASTDRYDHHQQHPHSARHHEERFTPDEPAVPKPRHDIQHIPADRIEERLTATDPTVAMPGSIDDRQDYRDRPVGDRFEDTFHPTNPDVAMNIPRRNPFETQEEYESGRDKYWAGHDGFAAGGVQRDQDFDREIVKARQRESERKLEGDRLYRERMEDEYAKREGGA